MKQTKKLLMVFLLLSCSYLSNAQGWTNNSGFLYYNQGNVGIGTSISSPANLHIGKQEAPAHSTGEVLRLSLQPYGHTGGPWNFISRDTYSSAFLDFKYNGLPILSLTSDGTVGIGTLTPGAKLDVNGIIRTYNKDNATANWDNLSLWSDGEHSYIYSYGDEKGLYLKSNNGNKIILDSFVGIGTYTPQNALDVNGTIRAKEVKVTLDGWSDFVFKHDYNLKPLSEVKQYLNVNGHLPEIPSETEVKQNGVNMGDMQAKLLQKIEELTLYMIKISEENESLRKEIETLKAKQ
ncbi:hypothetical protein [uncultured Acetobacteroides sp.]|uniref:hypothetical protein n=1 Tax=uncultured Acetobacteroides sp. TaxID=1760811 RepID=UPI0029F537B7|nr:hypothetical protein [uncultured Acetobacteroides sp.]